MELTKVEIFKVLGTDNEFPIDFDEAWRWIEYSKKSNAKRALELDFVEELDFCSILSKNAKGRPVEKIWLTIDCFKSFCMMAGTSKGKEVRQYFLNCEKELKRRIFQDDIQAKSQRFVLSMYVGNPQEWAKQFKVTFYQNIYRLKGWEFPENHRYNGQVGRITSNIVYERIQPGLWEELKAKNPDKKKIRFHQLLTKNVGNPHLREHLRGIIRLMESCNNWSQFEYQLDRQYPIKEGVQLDLFFDVWSDSDPDGFKKFQASLDGN